MEQIKLLINTLGAPLKDKETLRQTSLFLIKITLIPLILFWFAYLTNFILLRQAISLYLIFFLPGYLLTPIFFSKADKTEKFVLSYIISVFIVPLAGYLLALKGFSFNELSALLSLHLLIIILSIFFVISKSFTKNDESEIKRESFLSLFIVLGFFVVLMSILLKIYPFLPEADPYYFYPVIENLINTGIHPQIFYRPFFSFFIGYICLVGNFSIWIVMKYILAFLPIFPLAIFWEYARGKSSNYPIRIIFPLLFLSVPALFIGAEVIIPQIFFVSIFPICLYFLHKAIRGKLFMPWVLVFTLSFLSVKYHELGLFLIAISAFSFPFVIKIKWRNIKLPGIVLGLILTFVFFGIVMEFARSVLKVAVDFFDLFGKDFTFKPWFLDNFTNIDNVTQGWSGIEVIKYYAYLVGSVLPIVLILGFSRTVLKKILRFEYIPFWVSFILFFLIAEVFPRFNTNFLPDRAWLFVTITLIFFSLPFLEKIVSQTPQKLFVFSIIILFLISFGGSFHLAYAKQGYVSQEEYAAAEYLKNNTPENSVIVSQQGNAVLINFFGKRKMFFYKPIFYVMDSVRSQNLDALKEATNEFNKENSQIDTPVYILYSFDKNKNLASQREWWRKANFADAKTAALSSSSYMEEVFNNGNVIIWKVNFDRQK